MPFPIVVGAVRVAMRWLIRRAIPIAAKWAYRKLWPWIVRTAKDFGRWVLRRAVPWVWGGVRWGFRAGGRAVRWGFRTAWDGFRWGLRITWRGIRWGLRTVWRGLRWGLPRLIRWGFRFLRRLPRIRRMLGSLGLLSDEIVVTVTGGPRSNVRRLFRLAAAVAFGKVRRMVPAGGGLGGLGGLLPPPGSICVQYSLERREVTFVVRYERSLATIAAAGAGVAAIEATPVLAGPHPDTVGGNFDYDPSEIVGGVVGLKVPKLEFEGRMLLTPEMFSADPVPDPARNPDTEPGSVPLVGVGPMGLTQNHRPSGDARSRGSLVRMVTAALSQPTQSGPATFNLPNDTNRFTGG